MDNYIGDHVEISSDVKFITHDGGILVFSDKEKYKNTIKHGAIITKDNCFLGMDSISMPGAPISIISLLVYKVCPRMLL